MKCLFCGQDIIESKQNKFKKYCGSKCANAYNYYKKKEEKKNRQKLKKETRKKEAAIIYHEYRKLTIKSWLATRKSKYIDSMIFSETADRLYNYYIKYSRGI
jgi:quinolinate synthase